MFRILLVIGLLAVLLVACATVAANDVQEELIQHEVQTPKCATLSPQLAICDVWSPDGVHCVVVYGTRGGGLSCDWDG